MKALPAPSGAARRLDPETRARIRKALRTRAERRAVQAEPDHRRSVRLRLWLPLSALWVLLSPLAILAIPLLGAAGIGAAGARRRIRPVATVVGLGGLLFAMSGTLIEIEAPGVSVNIRLL
ncbi:MAG: hypothetical protein ACHP9T_05405 [Caulobacterales bacterium]|jgi:hypothetical protein